MSEWDFADGLHGQELQDALSSGATAEEWAYIDAQDRKRQTADAQENEIEQLLRRIHRDGGNKQKPSRDQKN